MNFLQPNLSDKAPAQVKFWETSALSRRTQYKIFQKASTLLLFFSHRERRWSSPFHKQNNPEMDQSRSTKMVCIECKLSALHEIHENTFAVSNSTWADFFSPTRRATKPTAYISRNKISEEILVRHRFNLRCIIVIITSVHLLHFSWTWVPTKNMRRQWRWDSVTQPQRRQLRARLKLHTLV